MGTQSLNIVLATPSFFPHTFGGGEQYVLRLAKELLKRSHRVEVITQSPWEGGDGAWLSHSYRHDGIAVTAVALNPRYLSPLEQQGGVGPVLREAFSGVLDRLRPDLVHINGIKPLLTALCCERGIPHLVTGHHAGIACPAGGWIREDGSRCRDAMGSRCVYCCNWWRRPRWYTGGFIGRLPSGLHNFLGARLNRKGSLNYLERGLIYPWFVQESIAEKRMVLNRAQRLVAPSRFMAGLLEKNGCRADKISVIPHGIEPMFRSRLGSPAGRPLRFGYVGRIEPLKGVHTLMEAAGLLEEPAEIHIFGAARNPRDEAYFRKALEAYRGRSRIVEHGLLQPERIGEAYRDIDVLVVPSHVPESFGFVVLEAFSAGRPVIVFNSGALPELVRDGVDGVVTERNDAQALAKAMRRFSGEPGLLERMADATGHRHTLESHVCAIEKVYRELLG